MRANIVPNRTLAVVSQSHPLWVIHSPAVARGETMTLQFPNAPPWFDVVMRAASRATAATLAIVVGGIRIPIQALQQHVTLRRMQMLLRNARPLRRFFFAIEVLLVLG